MEASTRLKVAFKEGRQTVGMWQMLPGANISRLLSRTGVDWVCVDCEHGNIDDGAMHDAVPAIAATGVSPIVRIPDLQPWMVKRALDSGAHGLLVPLIKTVEETKQLIRSVRFPPAGERGYGSLFALERFQPMPTLSEYLQEANDIIVTIIQIETKEALDAVDEIAAVEGVDALFLGPFDLGNNIGHPIIDGVMDTELTEALQKTFAATRRAGKKCGIFAASAEQARQFKDEGYDMVVAATDYTTLRFSLRASMDVVMGQENMAKGGMF